MSSWESVQEDGDIEAVGVPSRPYSGGLLPWPRLETVSPTPAATSREAREEVRKAAATLYYP